MGAQVAEVLAQLQIATAEALTSPELREEMEHRAEHGAEHARALAESELTDSRRHVVRGGHVNEPGDYARSIEGLAVFEANPHAADPIARLPQWRGRVWAKDWKSWWIEYGTKKWPKHAILRRTAGYLDGTES